jgi:hypothetical protein
MRERERGFVSYLKNPVLVASTREISWIEEVDIQTEEL